MVKSVLGIAAATMLAAAVMPTAPANAAPIQNAPGIAEHQSGVETVQYRRYNRRYYRGPVRRGFYGPGRYAYGGGPYYYGGGPYAYGGVSVLSRWLLWPAAVRRHRPVRFRRVVTHHVA